MTEQRLQLAQGTITPVGGLRIGVVNVDEGSAADWARVSIVGGAAQVDAVLRRDEPVEVEGLGTVTFVGVVVPADAARGRGPVIELVVVAGAEA